MQTLYDMIFVEKDIFMIVCLLIFVIAVIAIVIGVTAPKRKAKKGIAMYKVFEKESVLLNQPIVQTDNKFTAAHSAQDELLKKTYPIGKEMVLQNGYKGRISRVKKETVVNMNVTALYKIYFEEFEYSELPCTLSIRKQKKYDTLQLTKEGLVVLKEGTIVSQKKWDELRFAFIHIRYDGEGLALYDMTEKVMDYSWDLPKSAFDTDRDYYLLAELLVKYAKVSM